MSKYHKEPITCKHCGQKGKITVWDNPYDKYSIYGRLACLRLDDMAEFYSDDGGLSEAKYDPTEPKGIW